MAVKPELRQAVAQRAGDDETILSVIRKALRELLQGRLAAGFTSGSRSRVTNAGATPVAPAPGTAWCRAGRSACWQ